MFLFGKTREGWLHGEDRAPGARKSRERSRSGDRRRARFQLEPLEGRQLLSWGSVPPALITPPVNSPPSTYVYGESLSTPGDAYGSNTNLHGEVDFYHFTATQGGTYLFDAASPGHAVDTVIAVYDSSGHRLAYDDDIAPGNTDSEASVALQAGHQYFLGVTNYISNTTHGSYNWSIDGPAHLAPVEQAIVDLTNQERQSAGPPTLAVNAQLVQAAQIHATNMARLDRLSHILPGTSLPTPEDRLSYVGYSYSSWGENIAYNYRDASDVVDGWMHSPGHRANMLSPNYTEIGVGVALNSQGQPYYCLVFGRPL